MKTVFILLISALLFSCKEKSNGELTADQKQALQKAVQPTITQIKEAALKCDLAKMLDAFEESKDFRFIGMPGQVLDFAGFREMVTQFYSTANSENIKVDTEHYTFLSDQLVMWTFEGSVEIEFKNGWKQQFAPFAASFLFKKTNEQWKTNFLQESYPEAPQNELPKAK